MISSTGNGGLSWQGAILTGFGRNARLRRPAVTGTRQDKIVRPDYRHSQLLESITASRTDCRKIQDRYSGPVSLTGATPSGACQDTFTGGER